MDLAKFHQLYNFRKRSPEELEALKELQSYSRSCSRSSSSSSSRSSSSCCSTCCSSRSSSRRSRSRSLPYSIPSRSCSSSSRSSSSSSSSSTRSRSSRLTSGYRSEDSEDSIEAVDALLEAPFIKAAKRKSSSDISGKKRYKRSRSHSPGRSDHAVLATQLSNAVTRKDVEAHFSKVGKIKDILLLFCPEKRIFKGVARVEFCNIESVILVSVFFFMIIKIANKKIPC